MEIFCCVRKIKINFQKSSCICVIIYEVYTKNRYSNSNQHIMQNLETVVFLLKVEHLKKMVSLYLKMQKVGSGKRNGCGGKFNPLKDRDIFDTAIRELKEESSVICRRENLTLCAVIEFFHFGNTTDIPDHKVAFFTIFDYEGEPQEVEPDKMQDPKWFYCDDLPEENMLPADKEFIPKIFAGETFTGKVYFKEHFAGVENSKYTPVSQDALVI